MLYYIDHTTAESSNILWFMNGCYTMVDRLQVLRYGIIYIHTVFEKINNIIMSLLSYFYIIIYSKIILVTGKNRRYLYSTSWRVIFYVHINIIKTTLIFKRSIGSHYYNFFISFDTNVSTIHNIHESAVVAGWRAVRFYKIHITSDGLSSSYI